MAYAASESDFLITVDGIQGYWATLAWDGISTETSKSWNGGDDFPTTVVGKSDPGSMTVTRPYDPRVDSDLVHKLIATSGWRTSASSQPIMNDKTVVGKPLVFSDIILTAVKPPDSTAGSSAAAMLSLTFGVSRVV